MIVSRESFDRHEHLLQELAAERVAALARISRTLEGLLDQLGHSRSELSRMSGRERITALTRYRQLRERAVKYRWYLEVQREALGLRHHDSIDQFYQVPGPIDE